MRQNDSKKIRGMGRGITQTVKNIKLKMVGKVSRSGMGLFRLFGIVACFNCGPDICDRLITVVFVRP